MPVTESANSPLCGVLSAVASLSYGSKQAMSVMAPVRRGAQRIRTRMPVFTASGPGASRTWSRAVSAPSSLTSTQANGVARGWSRRGAGFQAQVVTVPVVATSASSRSSSAVTGSYSTGGTRTLPSPVRTPSTVRSRSPVRKALWTGPRERVKGNSTTSGALRTSGTVVSLAQARR